MIPVLGVVVPDLFGFVCGLRDSIDVGRILTSHDFDARCHEFFTASAMDEIEMAVPGWKQMASYGEGVTLRHTVRAMTALLGLVEYERASAAEQRMMEWTVLLHDLAKEPRAGHRDFVHAFRSAARAGVVLSEAGFPLTAAFELEFEPWYRLTYRAHRFDEDHGVEVQDNKAIPEIMDGADRLFGDAAAVVVKAIALHQSVTVVTDWPASAPLSREQEAAYIDADVLPVLAAILLADSGGWELFDQATLAAMYDQTRTVVRRLGGN